MRIDRWLWVTRFYKTRSLAIKEIENGRILINGERIKPARTLKIEDEVSIRRGDENFIVIVRGFCEARRPAKEAQLLYQETQESFEKRMAENELRRIAPNPKPHSKPDKKDRQLLREMREK